MRAKKIIFIIVVVLFILSACNNNHKSIDINKLEVYILRNTEGSSDFDFVIDENPIFTGEDILSYDWNTHTITFKEEFIASREISETQDDLAMGGSKILGVYYPDQFAFYLDGEELYRGYMKPQGFISFMPGGPTISDTDDGITIKCINEEYDTRKNAMLMKFLEVHDLLK